MKKRIINAVSAPQPASAYSQAVEVTAAGRILFVSGQVGVDVRDVVDFRDVAAARAEVLGNRSPASTLFIGMLVNPAWKLEVEAVACA